MFGRPERRLRQLADTLAMLCPVWDARVMAFGPQQVVMMNTSPTIRTMYWVADGWWHTMTLMVDDDGDPIEETIAGGPVGDARAPLDTLVTLIVETAVDAYRAALRDPDAAALPGMQESAWAALRALTAGGR